MEMLIQLGILAIGFVMLVKGSDWFVDGASSIATKFGIPQLVIGLTIVAMGTSAPEAAVSITAAFHGNADITIGNIVGSNILNILIILGICGLISPMVVQKSSILVDIPVTIAITLVLLWLGRDGTISRLDGIILQLLFFAYLAYLFISMKKNKNSTDSCEVPKEMPVVKSLIFLVVGLVVIVLGSRFAVDAASAIARILGLSERFIGLTIVALGTSLPELFTSAMAALKKNSDIAIGNIVGSNIFNILMVVGLSGLIVPVPFVADFRFDTIVAVYAAVLLLVLALPKRKLFRLSGLLMLVSYAVYFYLIW